MQLESFRSKPLLGIVRGIGADAIAPLVRAVRAGGLETLEITMNTKGAPELIAAAREAAGDDLSVGAGTVVSIEQLERALAAGASFIVSPTLVRPVVESCVERGIPVFPGALTPQEIHDAWLAGASMVKVFPAKAFGPGYFREIKGPFDEIPLLACGGISAANLGEYARCGADAFAFGSSVFELDRIAAGDFEWIEASVRALVAALPPR